MATCPPSAAAHQIARPARPLPELSGRANNASDSTKRFLNEGDSMLRAYRMAISRRLSSLAANAAFSWRLLGVVFVAVGPAYVAPAHAAEDQGAAIAEIVRGAIAKYDLRAVIIRVTIDG